MAGPFTDELSESDPLLTFAEEAGEKLAEIQPVTEPVAQNRLDLIEQTIDQTQRDLAQIRSEIATLVGAVEDMKKRSLRRSAPHVPAQPGQSWTRATTATVSVIVGILIGGLIWTQLGSAKPVPVVAAPQEQEPVAAPADSGPRPETAPPSSPVAPATAAPAREQPAVPKREQQSAITPSTVEPSQPVSYFGALSIDADPTGEVFLNRQDAGRTPLRVGKLRAGSHLIWIEREGYQRWTRVVEVRADQSTHLSAELEPLAR